MYQYTKLEFLQFFELVEKLQRRFRVDTREATRNYRLNQWTEIVRECRSSGQTVAVWCAENSIKPRNYYYWLKTN